MCDNIGANTQYRPIAAKLRKITKCETIDNKNPYPIIFLLISFFNARKINHINAIRETANAPAAIINSINPTLTPFIKILKIL